jgi:C4-dicarboxylate-specific signal transduction histidine kinase
MGAAQASAGITVDFTLPVVGLLIGPDSQEVLVHRGSRVEDASQRPG